MPCPFCNGECTLIADSPADLPVFYYVDCSGGCGYSSKIEDVATEAIAAHNALCTSEQRGYERGVRECVERITLMQHANRVVAVRLALGDMLTWLRSLLPDNPTKANADQA